MDNVALFRKIVERGFNQGDLAVADEVCAAELIEHEYLAPTDLPGPEILKSQIRRSGAERPSAARIGRLRKASVWTAGGQTVSSRPASSTQSKLRRRASRRPRITSRGWPPPTAASADHRIGDQQGTQEEELVAVLTLRR